MEMGSRLLERLRANDMSQAELARRVGVSQPTINNLIHRGKVGSRYLHRIARELGTTPAYLAGETDDPDGDGSESLSADEQRLIKIYRDLPKKDRAALKLLIARMVQDDETKDR
jgi:transcriptional regulator with XRE-family HTH domain